MIYFFAAYYAIILFLIIVFLIEYNASLIKNLSNLLCVFPRLHVYPVCPAMYHPFFFIYFSINIVCNPFLCLCPLLSKAVTVS